MIEFQRVGVINDDRRLRAISRGVRKAGWFLKAFKAHIGSGNTEVLSVLWAKAH